jgi:hypothetical protein
MNADQSCECNANWEGESCEFYRGPCDPKCLNCAGETDYDCLECTYNAHRGTTRTEGTNDDGGLGFNAFVQSGWPYAQTSGNCQCNEGWSGDACDEYVGECSPTCFVDDDPATPTCTQDRITCVECIENSGRNDFGECVCLEDWDNDRNCRFYSGKCHPLCSVCDGPTEADCMECSFNAEFKDVYDDLFTLYEIEQYTAAELTALDGS